MEIKSINTTRNLKKYLQASNKDVKVSVMKEEANTPKVEREKQNYTVLVTPKNSNFNQDFLNLINETIAVPASKYGRKRIRLLLSEWQEALKLGKEKSISVFDSKPNSVKPPAKPNKDDGFQQLFVKEDQIPEQKKVECEDKNRLGMIVKMTCVNIMVIGRGYQGWNYNPLIGVQIVLKLLTIPIEEFISALENEKQQDFGYLKKIDLLEEKDLFTGKPTRESFFIPKNATVNDLMDDLTDANFHQVNSVLTEILEKYKVKLDTPIFNLKPISYEKNNNDEGSSKYLRIINLVNEKGEDANNYSQEEIELLKSYEGKSEAKKEAEGVGILHEFFTPDEIIARMWQLAYKYGLQQNAKVLEPSCGVGRFFKYHNPKLITGYEIDKINYTIARVLYPQADIKNDPFETIFFTGNIHSPYRFASEFDLVIGNPPYGQAKGYYQGAGEKKFTKATQYDQYFITRGIDLLKPDGLLIMIIPSSFIRNSNSYNEIKEIIMEKSELLEAYRLPNNAFKTTYVGTDIIVLRKK